MRHLLFVVSGGLAFVCWHGSLVMFAWAEVLNATQGGHGDLEGFGGVVLAVMAGIAVAPAVGVALRSVIAGGIMLGVGPISALAVSAAAQPFATEALAPVFCQWPSNSGGQCANCARLLQDPRGEAACSDWLAAGVIPMK